MYLIIILIVCVQYSRYVLIPSHVSSLFIINMFLALPLSPGGLDGIYLSVVLVLACLRLGHCRLGSFLVVLLVYCFGMFIVISHHAIFECLCYLLLFNCSNLL